MSKLLVTDCDGVLTPMYTFYTESGRLFKVFSSHDSYAIKNFKSNGFEVVVISADEIGFPILEKRAKDWTIKAYHSKDKLSTLNSMLSEKKYSQIIYVGNGPEDMNVLETVDRFYAPEDCRPEVRNSPNKKIKIIPIKGGEGVLDYIYYDLLATK